MAGMFNENFPDKNEILDEGAAVGSLTVSVLDRIEKSLNPASISGTTYEVDRMLNRHLEENLSKYRTVFKAKGTELVTRQLLGDFIHDAVPQFVLDKRMLYTHDILNSTYREINSGSSHRKTLRLINLETVYLYAALVGVAINLLKR